jgi:hypothetical protein
MSPFDKLLSNPWTWIVMGVVVLATLVVVLWF